MDDYNPREDWNLLHTFDQLADEFVALSAEDRPAFLARLNACLEPE